MSEMRTILTPIFSYACLLVCCVGHSSCSHRGEDSYAYVTGLAIDLRRGEGYGRGIKALLSFLCASVFMFILVAIPTGSGKY